MTTAVSCDGLFPSPTCSLESERCATDPRYLSKPLPHAI
jgi:hypothetical protein